MHKHGKIYEMQNREGHTPRKQFRYINLTFKIVNHDHALDYITKFVF